MEALSLQSILEAFNVPLNEEQAWAVCYQSAKYLQNEWQVSGPGKCRCFNGVGSLELTKEGTVGKIHTNSEPAETEYELVQSLGVVIFHALDYGLPESDEQKLSPPLEQLIEKMTVSDSDDEAETRNKQIDMDGDEGIEHDEEEEFVTPKLTLEGVLMMCTAHLSAGLEPGVHYRAVCRALATEAMELLTFLDNIGTEKNELASAVDDELDGAKLEDLKRADWTCLWVQVMRELRQGIKLKKVEHIDHLPTEYELTPYEVLMEDIRSRRYTLNKVKMDENIPPVTKKDAHAVILDFIRSRPPLHPAKERKLKSPPPKASDIREEILEAIRKEPKLKPTPGRIVETSRTKLNEEDATPQMTRKVIKADPLLLLSNSFDEDDLDDDVDDEEEDVFSPVDDHKKVPVSVMPSIMSPLTPLSPRTPPTSPWQQKLEMNLATGSACFGSTDRRHSITVCESPARERAPSGLPVSPQNVPPLSDMHPSVLESELTNTNYRSVQSSLECLSLTIDEVMHIRNVLTKAELECLLVNPELHELVSKGKVCFTCKVNKFSLFGIWATKCKFCQRNVCSKCVSKMRIPTEHFEHIPVYTLSPSPMSPGYKNFDFLFPYEKTGSVPTSPVDSRKSFSPQPDVVNNNQGDGDNLQRVLPPKKLKFHSPPGQETKKVSENGSMKGGPKRRPLQRSQTVARPPPPRVLQGPVMNICKDCKAMVINVIRASRTSLAKAPKFGITTQNFVDLPPSKPSRNFTLDLKPVYSAK